MMSEPVKPPYRYGLHAIELRESHVHQVPPPDETASGLNFNINLENMVHDELGLVLCQVTVNVATQRSALPVGKLMTVIGFTIADYAAVVQKNEQGIPVIPSDLQAILNGVAISTTRGIMFGVFKGTPLHGALLPLMDVKAFAPELPLSEK